MGKVKNKIHIHVHVCETASTRRKKKCLVWFILLTAYQLHMGYLMQKFNSFLNGGLQS